jgi:NAD(P) transhydrogenase
MRSSRHHFDLIVIGSGPGGQRAATQAAKLRKRVAICERRRDVGGVSINSGTVPSKTSIVSGFRNGVVATHPEIVEA